MSRYERRQYFEQLCALRARYTTLGPDDTDVVISIDEAVALATALLDEAQPDPSQPVADPQVG